MIEIKNLHVKIEGKEILKGITLTIMPGEIHAIMGPNGAGKSTLAKVIAGDPSYEITSGEVLFKRQNILELDPEERAHLRIFVGFQYPIEIPGISNTEFLFAAYSALKKAENEKIPSKEEFAAYLDATIEKLDIPAHFLQRNLNEGFSGGEKKRNEILQMGVLDPLFTVLDETDSGLDIDALRLVAKGINTLMTEEKSLLLITHYQRLLDYIKPTFVHVLIDGQIVESGDAKLALELEEKGYDWLTAGVL